MRSDSGHTSRDPSRFRRHCALGCALDRITFLTAGVISGPHYNRSMLRKFDLVVIGTGSAASTVAYECRKAGWEVAC